MDTIYNKLKIIKFRKHVILRVTLKSFWINICNKTEIYLKYKIIINKNDLRIFKNLFCK